MKRKMKLTVYASGNSLDLWHASEPIPYRILISSMGKIPRLLLSSPKRYAKDLCKVAAAPMIDLRLGELQVDHGLLKQNEKRVCVRWVLILSHQGHRAILRIADEKIFAVN